MYVFLLRVFFHAGCYGQPFDEETDQVLRCEIRDLLKGCVSPFYKNGEGFQRTQITVSVQGFFMHFVCALPV